MDRIKELREKQQRAVAQAREKLAEIKDDTPEADVKTLEAAHDAAMAEYDRLEGQIVREQKLLDAEARQKDQLEQKRPGRDDVTVDPAAAPDAEAERRAAYKNYLRYGREGLSPEERKALGGFRKLGEGEQRAGTNPQAIADNTAGGYLVPEGFQNELVITMKAYGPMLDPGVTRELATSSGQLIPWPTMDDTANQGRRLTENTQVETTELAFGVKNLYAYKYTTDVVLVSSELLQDSAVDPEQIIRDAMAIRLGRVVNQDLTQGTGASQPNGIQTAATNTYQALSATAVSFDDVIELEHSLDPAYRQLPGVKFSFHDTTLKSLRKLKDGDGQYIWQPASVVAKAPASILGYNYVINQAQEQIGANNTSMLFGDFNRYVVRRVKEFMVRRLNERYADYDQVGFIGFARYDGNLTDSVSIRSLVHPA